jgi:hypothetical protein
MLGNRWKNIIKNCIKACPLFLLLLWLKKFNVLWCIDPLISGDSVNISRDSYSRCYVALAVYACAVTSYNNRRGDAGGVPGRLASRNPTFHFQLLFCFTEHLLITTLNGPRRTHSLYCKGGVLTGRCLAMDVLLLRAYACAGMCLPSPCLSMGL